MDGTQRIEFTVSAIVWVPYSFLLFYLFREHYARSRNLQSNILLLLACGAVFRCVWFFIDYEVYYIITEIINRIALLLQFSGLSLLMLMWSRAIAISKMTDIAYQESSEIAENDRSTVVVDSSKLRLQRYQEATQAVMSRLNGMNTFHHYIGITVAVNFIVWCFVLISLVDKSYVWYNINIIAISSACLLAALGTLFVGLWVSTALHVALSPVYVSSGGSATYTQDQKLKCVCMGRYGATCEYVMGLCGLCSLYAFIFNYNQSDTRQGLQMQREVLKVILSVSTITSFFFLIRSFCFMYRPVIEPFGGTDSGVFGDMTYPFFFYQIPEMVPNLVIALGISPPGGVLRRASHGVMYGYRVCVRTLCCGYRGSKSRLLNPQQSVFDNNNSESASVSPLGRPSYLAEVLNAPNAAAITATPDRPSSSAPIAIPLTRKSKTSSSKGNLVTLNNNNVNYNDDVEAQKGQAMDRGEGAATAAAAVAEETLSPVHSKSTSLLEEAPRGDNSNSLYSRDTSSSMGGMSSFQVESRTKSGSGHSFFGYIGGVAGRSIASMRSARSSLSGSSLGTQGKSSSSSSPRPAGGGRRGSNLFEDDDEWARERKNSAEIAEMLYSINSFSTCDNTLASSTGSGFGFSSGNSSGNSSRQVSTMSVDSNTITNSRRHHITDIVGGNRSLNHSIAGTPAEAKGKRGWFS